jgi:hypothetical protein
MNYLLALCLCGITDAPNGETAFEPPPAMSVNPIADWNLFYSHRPDLEHVVNDEDAETPPHTTLNACAPLRDTADFRSKLYETGVDGQFMATPREVDSDSPTYRQAMLGPEWKGWGAAIDSELANLTRNDVYEEVLEDTLPSWMPHLGRALAVVSILWVLKKKYVDGVFEKFKARAVYDGSAQKRLNASSASPLDTFAPTARHGTMKLLCSLACLLGAADTTLSSRAYILRVAAKHLPKPLDEYGPVTTPHGPKLMSDYHAAIARRAEAAEFCPALLKSYPSKVGAIIYAMPASRCDCAQTIGILSRCLTCPTPEMDAHADRCLVYLAQHAEDGITYRRDAVVPELHAYSDSDWAPGHSTSGWCIFHAGAVVAYGSKRQQSIALSSTEAEIMAASHAACEIVYYRGLLREMGVDMSKPTVLYVDNAGAVELSKDLKSCQRSRHVERRHLKIREWVHQGEITVKYRETAHNHADLLTKPLDVTTYRRHADAMFGGSANAGARPAVNKLIRQRTFDVEAAYLKGQFDGEVLYARPPPRGPPPGHRPTINGVPVVWRLKAPLYGEADAGRIWNRTLVKQLVSVQKFEQSEYDPCYFRKLLADGSRIDVVMYVDDGYVVDASSPLADVELKQLHDAFTIAIKPAAFFLGNNVSVAHE